MSIEQNKAIYMQFLDILNTGETDRLATIADADNFREMVVGVTPDWQTLPVAIEALAKDRQAIPDLTLQPDDLWFDGEWVIARCHAEGTNTGNFYGAPPSGNRVSFQAIDIVRIVNGKIVERSLMPDATTMLRQMSLTPGERNT